MRTEQLIDCGLIVISTSLNWFAAEYMVCSSVNIPSFLTILTNIR